MGQLSYRELDYFNENDLYLFKGVNYFLSKVEVDGEKVYTVKHKDRPQYKAVSTQCVNVNELNQNT